MFRLNVIRYFDAAHGLRNFQGADEPIHSHHWKIEVSLESDQVDVSGCAIDFHEVDRSIDEALAPFAGKSFNDIPPFDVTSPSAELIAKYLYERLQKSLEKNGVILKGVTTCEDDCHCATYFA
ncbi:MAG: 6-carboxytetrahydropterin synthase [Deltaproteobacteria bacterium]|nr:6-carboxytetrahydropterin synthase [Deltaproteobacteria bacterium]